jgi:hypothetical protein
MRRSGTDRTPQNCSSVPTTEIRVRMFGTLLRIRVTLLTLYFTVSFQRRPVAQAVSRQLFARTSRFVPAQSMWDLWWTKWHWDRFSCKSFGAVSIIPPLAHLRSCIVWGMDYGPISDPVPQKHSHFIATGTK